MGLERLVCQNCGSKDISYEDGFYVCRKCGTKHIMQGGANGAAGEKNYEKVFVFPDEDNEFLKLRFYYSCSDDSDNGAGEENNQENCKDSKMNNKEAQTYQKQSKDGQTDQKPNKSEETTGNQDGAESNYDNNVWLKYVIPVLSLLFFFHSCGFDSDKVATDAETVNAKTANTRAVSTKGNAPLWGFFSPNLSDLELIVKNGHPRLGDSKKVAKEFYNDYKDRAFVDRHYKSTALIFMECVEENYTSDDNEILDRIQIYPENGKDKAVISLNDAIKISEGYLPWEILEKYYMLNKTYIFNYAEPSDYSKAYGIRYVLKDIYNSSYKKQEHNMPFVYETRIYIDRKSGSVSSIRMERGYIGSGIHEKEEAWEPDNLRPLPAEPSTVLESWQLLRDIPKPRLLDDMDTMLAYGKKLGEERVYLAMRDRREALYGLSRDNQLVSARFVERKDDSKYIFSIGLDFTRFNKEKVVSVSEAVELARGYLPYDAMDKYYTLRFARKKIPTDKNIDGVAVYEVVYDRVVSKANKAEIREKDIPRNLRVVIEEDLEGNVRLVNLNCYTYSPRTTSIYKLVTDEDGEPMEVRVGGRELGPYEEDDDWNTYEPWENPF